MSLDSNVSDLAARIGQEIKDVRADMALISGGGGSGTQNVYIQESEPMVGTGEKVLWIQTNADGSTSVFIKEGE